MSQVLEGIFHHAEMYLSAYSICALAGGRLWTVKELLNNCTWQTGCNHDKDMLWSSSEVVLEVKE